MKLRSGSLVFASLNVAVIAVGYVCWALNFDRSVPGRVLVCLPLPASPFLLLATAVYLPRELAGRDTRPLAIIALAVSIPCVLFLLSWRELA